MGRLREDRAATWLIVAATAWWAALALPGWFHQDDGFYIYAASHADLWDWLGRIYWQHFAPGHRAAFWLIGSESPGRWLVLQLVLVGAFGAGLWFFYRSLCLLYGRSWWLLVPLAITGFAWQFSLGFAYPSAGLQVVPEFAFGTLCLYAFLRHVQGGGWGWLAVSGAAYTLGLAFYIRMLLLPLLLLCVRYLFLERDVQPRHVARTLWDERATWFVFALPTALYLRYFWQHTAFEAAPPGGMGDLVEFLRTAWLENVAPGFLGIRLGSNAALVPIAPATVSGAWAIAAGLVAQLLVLSLLALSVLRKRAAAWRPWAFILVALASTFWLTARGKIGTVGVTEAANDPRYVVNLCWLLPLGVLFALDRRRVVELDPEARVAAPPRNWRAVAVACAVAAATAFGMSTAWSVERTWQDQRAATQRYARSPRGEVAQLVEHTTENRGVAGSIPALAMSQRLRAPCCVLGVRPRAAPSPSFSSRSARAS